MSGENVVIRPVKQTDAEQMRENCFSMNTLEQTQSLIQQNLAAFEEGKCVHLVADIAGEVIGTVILTREEHPLEAHRAELSSLVVHPDYQRRGIARRLVEASKSYARDMGVEILEISCRGGEAAETVYRRLGFIEWGRLPRGLIEPWGNHAVYDMVHFYQPLTEPESSCPPS
jgi:GNAT superfamily N-acetyltransferase